jgi:hypothetical protein
VSIENLTVLRSPDQQIHARHGSIFSDSASVVDGLLSAMRDFAIRDCDRHLLEVLTPA